MSKLANTNQAMTWKDMDSRRDEASSVATMDSFWRNINNNWGQKTEVEDLQSARYQGDLEVVTDRFNQLKVIEEGKKKLSTKSSSDEIEKWRQYMLTKKTNRDKWSTK